ncbi:cell surface protein [Fusobacterium animalis 11_3_2]|uniref:Cell surface protein n=1 Tax=Fusobacterium animalis 11_3_2 TaxID=457403 RepID=F7KZV3_9FUSO|nr:YadA-like family protein [Fusobacterium animalis]EGN67108.1 cell surface protein [Fusobacterium animalis 11_3_2]
MKKSNLRLLAFVLFLVLAQNSIAANKVQEGNGSEAASDETVAVGLSYTDGQGEHKNIAGNPAEPAVKYYASAIGIANTASGKYSSAFGFRNEASGEDSSAFGFRNKASGEDSSAFGFRNEASGEDSSAFGYNNITYGKENSAFGYRNRTIGEGSSAFGYENEATEKYSSAFGYINKAKGERASAFGFANLASGFMSSAFGYQNTASRGGSSTFGHWNRVNGMYSSAFGSQYEVTGNFSGAFGVGKVTINASGKEYKYINKGNNSYMIGNYNKIASGSNNNFILGNNVSIANGISNSVVLGNGSTVSSSNEVSVGSKGKERKITNVGDGVVSNTSTDAVTGRQLFSGDGIDTAAWKAKLGVGSGGVDLTAYSKRDASNLTATDISAWRTKLGVGAGGGGGVVNTATGIGSTGLGIDNTVTGNNSTAVGYKNKVSGNKSGAFGDPNVVTGNGSYAFGNDNTIKGDNNFVLGNNVTIDAGIQNSVALGNGSTVSSSNEVSVGSATQKRKITNVADGEVSATSTDAVNGRQLYNAMQNSNNTFKNEVNEKIDNVKNEVRNVGSLSAALAGLHPMQYDPKAPTQVMAALGHYKNKQAVAIGASYHFNDRFMMSTGIALSGEKRTETMANVGFTVKLGKGSGVAYNETPQYVVQNEVKRLTVENQELKEKVNAQGAENKDLKERVQKLEEKLNKLLTTK